MLLKIRPSGDAHLYKDFRGKRLFSLVARNQTTFMFSVNK